MERTTESLAICVLAEADTTERRLSPGDVKAVGSDQIVATALSDNSGVAELEIGERLWQEPLTVRIDHGGQGAPVTREVFADATPIQRVVHGQDYVDPGHMAILADHPVTTRRAFAGGLVDDPACPPHDSLIRLLTPSERARLLAELGTGNEQANARLVNPDALRAGTVACLEPHDLGTHFDFDDIDLQGFTWTRPFWDLFPWALPDGQSCRDYLRGVFVLFAHQRKLGVSADVSTFPTIGAEQLKRRFPLLRVEYDVEE